MRRRFTRSTSLSLCFVAVALLAGCGAASTPATCVPTGFAFIVRPVDPTAAPDHAATPPGNQEAFEAALGDLVGPEPCIFNPLYQRVPALWTTSDPQNVRISSANDATNGVATCLGTTKPERP
jgi:hypothetical protein